MTINAGLVPISAPVTVNVPSQLGLDLSLSLGKTLKELLDRALMVVETAPSKVVRDIGQELAFSITTFQDAYRASLNQTVDGLDNLSKNCLSQLNSVVKQFEERNKIEQVQKSFQQFANSFIFATNYPQCTSMFPHCVALASNINEFILNFVGNFPEAANPNFKPSLKLNGCEAKLVRNETQQLSFCVSTADAFPQNLNNLSIGFLTVPYSTLVRKEKKSLQYRVAVMALPASPGLIVIEHTKSAISRDTNLKTSMLFQLNSRKKYGGLNRSQICRLDVTAGWKLLHGSAQLKILKSKGKRSLNFLGEDERGVSYKAETYHHEKDKKSGKLYFTISFTEYREFEIKEPFQQTPITLEWGSSKVFNHPPRTWKVIFKPFDGSPQREFIDSHSEDPYIDISVEGNNLRIGTTDPLKIKMDKVISQIKTTFLQEEKDNECELGSLTSKFLKIAPYGISFGAGVWTGITLKSRL